MAGHTTLVMLISLWAVMELKLEFHWGPQNTSHKMKKRHTQNTNNPPNCGAWKANQTIDLDDLDH